MNVLIAEDDLTSRDILTALLEKNGYNVTAVENGKEALRLMRQPVPPHIVILDWLMPGIDGLEVCRRIRAIKTEIPTYIIMLTVKGNKDDIITGLDTGADDYLSKPYDPEELRARIDVGRRIVELEENQIAQTRILSVTQKNYETFFNTIDDFLFVLDEQGNIIHANKTVIERLGYSMAELHGKSVLMVHPPERRDEAGRIVGEMLTGKAEFCPVPILTKSGTPIPVETRVSHGMWDGKPVLFGVTKDISRMQLSEEKFSKLFHINPSACGLSNLDDHIYIEVNEAFYSLFCYEKNEVIGKTAAELGILTPESISSIMNKADSNGNVTNVEVDLKAKNGEIKHVLLSSENIYVQDKRYRFTVVHDITERKIAEDKIKSLLSEKELLLKEVHHRIKNNMNTIKGLLFLQADGTKDSAIAAILHDAENRVQIMMILYDKLYCSSDFRGMQSRSYLGTLVDDIIANFPNNSIVKVDKKIEDFYIKVNILLPLGIIINEILTNMMKYAFTGRGSGVINVSISLNGSYVTFILSDNGNGIPDSVSFENSTGFGLTLVNMLTQQIGGTIRIERGIGTKFILEFDLH